MLNFKKYIALGAVVLMQGLSLQASDYEDISQLTQSFFEKTYGNAQGLEDICLPGTVFSSYTNPPNQDGETFWSETLGDWVANHGQGPEDPGYPMKIERIEVAENTASVRFSVDWAGAPAQEHVNFVKTESGDWKVCNSMFFFIPNY